MLNRSVEPRDSTSTRIPKAFLGIFDIKRHSPSMLYMYKVSQNEIQ